jgi:lactobin A/cerein 7B family class IIb bacteriocin
MDSRTSGELSAVSNQQGIRALEENEIDAVGGGVIPLVFAIGFVAGTATGIGIGMWLAK